MLLADEVAAHHPVLSDNPYQPHLARIVRIEKMIENTQVFTLRFLDEHLVRSFRHQPGQFVMLSIPGTGEMPIWGDVFKSISANETFGQMRVDMLVKYLQSIQR